MALLRLKDVLAEGRPVMIEIDAEEQVVVANGATEFTTQADTIAEKTSGSGVTVDGVLLKDSTVKTDTIIEKTGAAGVTADGVLLKDSTVKTANGAVGAVAVGNAVDNGLIFGTNTASIVTGGTEQWSVNSSGALNPASDNAKDIGNLLVNPRDIHVTRALIKKGAASTEGYGQLALKSISASKAFAGGATEVIPTQVPAGAKIVGCQLRNDTILVATTGVSYSAAYSTGSTQAIGSGIAFTKNTKTNKMFDANGATDVTSGLTDITLTPNAGTLDTGTVTAIVYYYEFTTMSSAA